MRSRYCLAFAASILRSANSAAAELIVSCSVLISISVRFSLVLAVSKCELVRARIDHE